MPSGSLRGLSLLVLVLARPLNAQIDACEPTATSLALASDSISACSATFDSEDHLLASSCTEDVEAEAVCRMMRRGWWRAAKLTLPSVPDEKRANIRKFLEAYRTGAGSIIQALQRGGGGERSLIVPACQWAQNQSVVAVMVRYSPKKHGPVSIASVDEPRVHLNSTHLEFEALANPRAESGKKPLRFLLEVCPPAC